MAGLRNAGRITVLVLGFGALPFGGRAVAQDSKTELGTMMGVTIINSGGSSNTHFGVPSGIGPLSILAPALYATMFTGRSLFIEPQFGVSAISGGGSTSTILTFVGQVGFRFNPEASSSPYVAFGGALQRVGGEGSSALGTAIGGELGYRSEVRSNLAIRVNVRARRWFSDFSDTNEFGFALGLGAVL
ncbi:MAG TPA: hypothetical protein VJY35_10245 [Candidatus Eisenbacteria bacterium]|nr:hypothetical protein [Candidatus Eisenbacteria bacterium]